MAELTVQPKKKPIWPWIIVLLLIVAVALYFLLGYNKNMPGDNIVPITSDSTTNLTDTNQRSDTMPRTDTMMKPGQ
jgi:hypothetical protein